MEKFTNNNDNQLTAQKKKIRKVSVSPIPCSLPDVNMENFPAFDSTGKTIYYYGAFGNKFYGLDTDEKINTWTLVDTDGKITGGTLESSWGEENDGTKILEYTNSISGCLTKGEAGAVRPKAINTRARIFLGEGEMDNAIFWPLSMGQFSRNMEVAKKIFCNICSPIWTRDFCILGGKRGAEAWTFDVGYEFDSKPVTEKAAVVPAFDLDLSRVLLVRPYNEGPCARLFGEYKVPDHFDGYKYLVMADAEEKILTAVPDGLTDCPDGVSVKFQYVLCTKKAKEMEGSGEYYFSGIIYDEDGKIVYQGNVKKADICSPYGEAPQVFIPDSLPAGDYTVGIFLEKKNHAWTTDYATVPCCFPVQITEENRTY